MKIEIQYLTGLALRYAVILANHKTRTHDPFEGKPSIKAICEKYPYDSDWGMSEHIFTRVIEEGWQLSKMEGYVGVKAFRSNSGWAETQEGPTILVAACRAYVASKLGPSVEIPEELL